jgi:hypothetical protein
MAVAVVFFSLSGSAQLSEGEPPVSFQLNRSFDTGETIILPGPDLNLVSMEDELYSQQTGREAMGRRLYCDFGTNDIGQWHQLSDGSMLWTARFKSEGALALAVIYEDLKLPEGARLWGYTVERDFYDGPHEANAINDWFTLVSGDVYGEEVIIEYHQPAGIKQSTDFKIKGIAYFYRYIYDLRYDASRGSDPCQVDVNCPEGAEWLDQRNSVVRLLISDGQFFFLCSGVMMNNTNSDCRQLMLTAYHCVNDIAPANFNQMVARFNFEKSGCLTGVGPSTRNRTGMTLLAHSNDGGGNSGSDFALFEINPVVPLETWNVYFAGWSALNSAASTGVSIHHPSGDFKKISTFTQALTSATWWQAANAHWRVIWAPTANGHGVTEGGSSGSPIFNQNKRVVGTLTGGTSFCTAVFAPDMYGKMSHHWLNNPNSATMKLKVWLDPMDWGVSGIDGTYSPCNNLVINTTEVEAGASVSIFPNPASEVVTISGLTATEALTISLKDALGRTVAISRVNADRFEMDLTGFDAGIYVLNILRTSGAISTHKIVKQ